MAGFVNVTKPAAKGVKEEIWELKLP